MDSTTYPLTTNASRNTVHTATSISSTVPDRSLQGPGFSGTIAPEERPGVEGNVQGSMWRKMDGEARGEEDGTPEAAESSLFVIPNRFDKRYRAFLTATSTDWARKAVRVIKCRICPGAGFSSWDDFRRHCNSSEAHPLNILFCDHCGDFFARADSLRRHSKNPPPECLVVTPDEAEAKRRETEKVHKEFKDMLWNCLENERQILMPFSRVIKEMFPKSSKRGSREQSRRQAPKSWP